MEGHELNDKGLKFSLVLNSRHEGKRRPLPLTHETYNAATGRSQV